MEAALAAAVLAAVLAAVEAASAADRTEADLAAPADLVTDPHLTITITTAIGARAVIIGAAAGLAAR